MGNSTAIKGLKQEFKLKQSYSQASKLSSDITPMSNANKENSQSQVMDKSMSGQDTPHQNFASQCFGPQSNASP